MYDYWLGGKDNFAADRKAADRQARAIPQLPWLARQNRDFLRRAPGSYLVISHADVSPAHAVGTRRLTHAARELAEANRAMAAVPARTRDEIVGFFGDLTLVEPGLTDVWAWRPDSAAPVTSIEFMRILGGVARKD